MATASATYFAMIVYQRATSSTPNRQNKMALLVLGSLGWWCLCDAFFYVAPTESAAWFWHRLGALGWCGFPALTAYYFFVMTGLDRRMPRPARVAYWAVPLALTVRFLAAAPTGLTDGLVQSASGLGWTYVQGFGTVWPYAYLAYVAVYLGGALVHLYRWQRQVPSKSLRKLAKGFVRLDCLAAGLGVVSMLVIPRFGAYWPPMGFAAAMVFGLWYWVRLRDYDFTFVELALNPSYVYESCLDGLVVIDDDLLVLYANGEARRIMGDANPEGKPMLSFLSPGQKRAASAFVPASHEEPLRSKLVLASGAPVVCSASRTRARGSRLDVIILHLSDVGRLQQVQDELAYLAYHDAMTNIGNRRKLDELLGQWAAEADASNGDFALLFVDVKGFKHINDTYGHAVGDAVLVALADALRAALVPGEEVLRFAGDEFVALSRNGNDESLAARLSEAAQAVTVPELAGHEAVRVDVGACRYSEAGSTEALLLVADKRMYERKRAADEPAAHGPSDGRPFENGKRHR